MQLGARDASIPNGLVSSGLGLEVPSQTAEHDTGSLKSHASRLTDQPSDNRDTSGCFPLVGAGHLVVVKVQDAVSDIVTTGAAQCPITAYSNPKTPHEAPPPASDLGAGDLIDIGRRSDLALRRDQALTGGKYRKTSSARGPKKRRGPRRGRPEVFPGHARGANPRVGHSLSLVTP